MSERLIDPGDKDRIVASLLGAEIQLREESGNPLPVLYQTDADKLRQLAGRMSLPNRVATAPVLIRVADWIDATFQQPSVINHRGDAHATTPTPKAYGAACDAEGSTPVIVIHPGRLAGQPTIGHSRLPAALIADTYWDYGPDEVKACYGYLADSDILVCCWYVARYGTRQQRKRWKNWLPVADEMLWSNDTVKDCPWPERR